MPAEAAVSAPILWSDIITPAELSSRLKVSKSWPYEQMRPSARRRGNPLPVFKMGKLLRFHWPTVAAWLAAQQVQQAAKRKGAAR
jgi:hypothetical protein